MPFFICPNCGHREVSSARTAGFSSRGPVVYRSMRPGIGGVPFACLKFRTMYRDADQRQADLESLNEASGALFKMRDDPRMTPVGRFLRKYSIDELPQLFNVLRGDMSLVGPRPERVGYVARFAPAIDGYDELRQVLWSCLDSTY